MSCKKKYIVKNSTALAKGDKGDKGEDGPAGNPLLLLPLSTDDIRYSGQVLTTVLDNLLYVPLTINSFIAATSLYEKGVVLTSINLSWTYNKAVQSQTITGTGLTPPSLTVGARSVVGALASVGTNTVLTLTADDNTGDARAAKTATVNLTFVNKIYYGHTVTPGSINSAFVLGLSNNNLQGSRQTSFTVNAATNEYIWFTIPAAYGTPTFKTNGFSGGLSLQATFSFTNASGYAESYNVYRSDNHSLGSTVVDVL